MTPLAESLRVLRGVPRWIFRNNREEGGRCVQYGAQQGSDITRMPCLPSPLRRYKLYTSWASGAV
jgi:hypothetical protein